MSGSLVVKSSGDMNLDTVCATVLLIDDQPIIGEAVRGMFTENPEIDFHFTDDPNKALEIAKQIKPTVILQDLVMPGFDGLALVSEFRQDEATRDIPLIVLSTEEDSKLKADAFGCGANDYLIKLPEKPELLARIHYHSRGYIALKERNEAYDVLAKELAEAGHYVISTLPQPRKETPMADWRYMPSTYLGGDVFGYHFVDDDHFAVYLLDVCGHGVGAALLSVSLMNVLATQSLPNTDFLDPAAVLAGLNDSFGMDRHNNMFFTIWYGVIDRQSRELVYSSGGHPPAVLLNGSDSVNAQAQLLTTGNFIVGASPQATYTNRTLKMDTFARLFLFSDGSYEIVRQDSGKLWTLDEWNTLLIENGRNVDNNLDDIVRHVQDIQGSETFEDDFSLLLVTF